jgi:hypothetical protein
MLTPRLFFFFWLDGHAPDVKKSASPARFPRRNGGEIRHAEVSLV